MSMVSNPSNQSGFALLVSIVVVTVVLSVGLAILNQTIIQVRIASLNTDSEIAFHAASAGMECAQYWRRAEATTIESGGDLSGVLECFGVNEDNYSDSTVTLSSGSADARTHYQYEFSWPAGDPDRCTRVDMVAIVVPGSAGSNAVMTNADMQAIISAYPATAGDSECVPGGRCTTISVRGYNAACPGGGSNFAVGTVEREVLLEF